MTERSPFAKLADLIVKAEKAIPKEAQHAKMKIIRGRKGPWLSLQTHTKIWRWENDEWVQL